MNPEMENILEKAIEQRPYTEDGTRLPARLNIPHLKKWNTVICIGDSINEGLWDSVDPDLDLTTYEAQEEYPDSPVAGWADRLAGHLSARREEMGLPPVKYANLAIRGKLIKDIVENQLPKALELKPDLILMDGGGNDILEPGGPSITKVYNYIRTAVRKVRRTGCDLLYLLPAQPGDAVVGMTRSKQSDYAARLQSLMMRYDCYAVDLWNYTNFSDARMWSEDRIHPTPEAHERIAQIALISMGLSPDPVWANGELRRPLPGHKEPLGDRAKEEARWIRLYFTPWLGRRIKGTSSGDNRTGKRLVPTEMPPFVATTGSKIFDREFEKAQEQALEDFEAVVSALDPDGTLGIADSADRDELIKRYKEELAKDGIIEDATPHRYTPEQLKQMWIAQNAQLAVDIANGISPEESWREFRKKKRSTPANKIWAMRDLKPSQTSLTKNDSQSEETQADADKYGSNDDISSAKDTNANDVGNDSINDGNSSDDNISKEGSSSKRDGRTLTTEELKNMKDEFFDSLEKDDKSGEEEDTDKDSHA